MRPVVKFSTLLALSSLVGCGHYYRAYRVSTYAHVSGATDAVAAPSGPVVIVEDQAFGAVASSGAWSAEGWATGGATAAVAAPAWTRPPLAASVEATGDAHGLLGLVARGVQIDCALCEDHDAIAALSLLAPLGAGSLGVDTGVLTSPAVRVEVSLAHDALPASGGTSAIVLRVIGGPAPATVAPVRVHLVIDASTSMEARWDEVIASALTLVGRLRSQDELQIVSYSTTAQVALAPTPVGDRVLARAAIRRLRCGGRTNIEAGLRAAYGSLAAGGASIVLLLSDGVPQGGLSTPRELGVLAGEARTAGATTITIGLGSEFHPGVLRSIARHGGGDFRIAPGPADLEALFGAELDAHARIVAHDVAIEMNLAPGVRLDAGADLDGLDSAVRIEGAHVSVRLAAVSSGEARSIVLPIATDHASAVADVSASAQVAQASTLHGAAQLTLGIAMSPVPAGALLASLDADLAEVLLVAASGVENGDARLASDALRGHAARVRMASGAASTPLHDRIEHTLAFAAALDALVPDAGWGARRQTAALMLEWSGGL